jgi:hypothetical protein
MRDDFPKTIADTLAKRVGNHCSNPLCGKRTSGPHTQADKALNLGVAAHLTAASPGGPRYDSSLDSEQRKAISNGIWLCQTCSKLIDNDEERFPLAVLKEWKEQAENKMLREVGAVRNDHRETNCESGTANHATLHRQTLPISTPSPLQSIADSITAHLPVGSVISEDTRHFEPTLQQMEELVRALEQFVWHDGRSFFDAPWAQEKHRLPGFVRVVDAMAPLRGITKYEGWPRWLPTLIDHIAMVFDVIAHAWGWGELLKPESRREEYKRACQNRFNEQYLLPIQAAAKACYGEFTMIERPHWLEKLVEELPAMEFSLFFPNGKDKRLEPMLQAIRRKDWAFLYGESYPTLSELGGDTHDFSAEVILGKTLGQASQKLAEEVKKVVAKHRYTPLGDD